MTNRRYKGRSEVTPLERVDIDLEGRASLRQTESVESSRTIRYRGKQVDVIPLGTPYLLALRLDHISSRMLPGTTVDSLEKAAYTAITAIATEFPNADAYAASPPLIGSDPNSWIQSIQFYEIKPTSKSKTGGNK